MLPVPKGRAGAEFLKLTFAVRTMAGGTCRGDLGSALGQVVALGALGTARVEEYAEGGAKGRGGGALPGEGAPAAGELAAVLLPSKLACPFLRAYGLAP